MLISPYLCPEINSNSMANIKNQHQFQFISGDFSAEEAKDLLMALISHKINFHNLHAFRDFVRFSGTPELSQKRISELTRTREEILKLLDEAVNTDKQLRIQSSIQIDLI